MGGRRGRIFIGGALVVLVLGLPAVWRMRARRSPLPGGQPVASDAGRVETQPPLPASDPDRAGGLPGDAGPLPAASAPEPRPDAGEWGNAPMAFGFRELGAMGPYVKAGLDAARRDMDFCFQQDAGAPQTDAGPRKPAVLLLYLEAREGALDVVEALPESRGEATPRFVECCLDVLRGYEIPAFKAVPGRRYRFRFSLE
jgi:hypothetical protein